LHLSCEMLDFGGPMATRPHLAQAIPKQPERHDEDSESFLVGYCGESPWPRNSLSSQIAFPKSFRAVLAL
jgi:hypothetical protein